MDSCFSRVLSTVTHIFQPTHQDFKFERELCVIHVLDINTTLITSGISQSNNKLQTFASSCNCSLSSSWCFFLLSSAVISVCCKNKNILHLKIWRSSFERRIKFQQNLAVLFTLSQVLFNCLLIILFIYLFIYFILHFRYFVTYVLSVSLTV